MSYLKDEPCPTCGTYAVYTFPGKPNYQMCFCVLQFEIEQAFVKRVVKALEPMLECEACESGDAADDCSPETVRAVIALIEGDI
jgi:hypothetical protein